MSCSPGIRTRASACSRPKRRLAGHQTSHSSGVIHAGIYYQPGSLKARLCVEGARELYAYCDEHGIHYERSGKLIVAVDEGELARLDELERRGRANEVPGLRRAGADEIEEIEPAARGSRRPPLAQYRESSTSAPSPSPMPPTCAVPGARSTSARRSPRATENGGRIAVRHSQGTTSAAAAVFCAGLWSDRLAVACGAPKSPRIVPFRGGYLTLPPEAAGLIRGNVYPVPNPDLPFLGAHLTPTVDGRVLIGPSALLAPARDAYRLSTVRPRDVAQTLAWPGTWRMAARNWRAGLLEMRHAASRRAFAAEAARLVPALRGVAVGPGPAGVRAQAIDRDGTLVDDFVVHRTQRAVHVRNAPSPAATSSLAIARLIADELAATMQA